MKVKNFVLKNKWWLVGFLLFFVLVIVGFWGYKQINKDVVATLSDQKIYKKDINKFAYGIVMSGTPESPDLENSGLEFDTLLDGYIESLILARESESLGINTEKRNVDKYISDKFPEITPEANNYDAIYDYQKYQYTKEQFEKNATGEREGRFVIAREDVYLPDQSREITEQDEVKISSSKVYAKKFIDEIYENLIAKSITFDEAINKELKDTTIGDVVASENSAIHSGSFNQEDYTLRTGVLSSDEVYNQVKEQKVGEFTKQIHLTKNIEGVDTDVAWVIVITDKSNGSVGQGFDSWYSDKYSQYKVTVRSK